MGTAFGCFTLVESRNVAGMTVTVYALPATAQGIDRAWAHLTGRLENPAGRRSMLHENEPLLHAAEVQRLIRAHAAFGGEDLVFLFDAEMCLMRVDRGYGGIALWHTAPGAAETDGERGTTRRTTG